METARGLDAFYSSDSAEEWKKILGEELHYHFGHFDSPDMPFDEALRAAVRNFYDDIPQCSRVLDAGCGWGGPARLLIRERGCLVKGITISSSQYRYCKSMGLDVTRADLESMDFGHETFDVAMMMESLVHIEHKEALLRKLRKVSSRLIIRNNCASELRHTLTRGPVAWLYLETPEMMARRLERAGWKITFMANRIKEAIPTLIHWQARFTKAYGDKPPPGQLSALKLLCDQALDNQELWSSTSPLIDVVAE